MPSLGDDTTSPRSRTPNVSSRPHTLAPWSTNPWLPGTANVQAIRLPIEAASSSSAEPTDGPGAASTQGPTDTPEPSGAGGAGGAPGSGGGGGSTAVYALLVLFAALSLLRFERLYLQPIPRRRAAFVSLLERPG
jgi:hypothetical protein